MKRQNYIAVFVIPLLYGCAHQIEPIASRAAWPGCQWEQHEFKELGVRILFQNCSDPRAHYVLSTRDNWLEQHRPADDVTFGGPHLLQVFTKPADQSIQEAIKERFIKKMVLEDKEAELMARESCQVFSIDHLNLGANKQVFTLSPTGDYKKKIFEELKEGPRDYGCGVYGEDQGLTYFEYHPLESTTRYAFVVYGYDEPHFDEQSIEFFEQ